MDEIKALTVRPPWSHFIAKCGKTVENRTWATSFRGLLAIHAGAGWDHGAESSPVALKAWREWSASLLPLNVAGRLRKNAAHVDFGAVIAVARLSGCHPASECAATSVNGQRLATCSEWAVADPAAWHWELAGVRPLAAPVPCKGRLGLWRLPEDAEKAVRAQAEDGHA